MPVILVEVGVVKQKWLTKSIEQLRDKFPNADLREDDAVCGQLDNGDGTYRDADPEPINPEILEKQRLNSANIKFKKLTLSALKDINEAQPNLFSAETKALYQELRALLR